MKKIFSILLTTALLSGMLLPMAVSAEDPARVTISATEETTIEFEDFKDSFVTEGTLQDGQSQGNLGVLKSNTGNLASNGSYLVYETGKFNTGATTKADIPVAVTEAGVYTIVITASDTGSKPTVSIGGTNYSYNTTAKLDGTGYANYYATAGWPGAEFYFNSVELPEGNTTITVNIPATSAGKFVCMIDCMKLRKKVAKIDTAAVTTIEFEDYVSNVTFSAGGARKNLTSTGSATPSILAGSDDHRVLYLTAIPNNYPYQVAPNKVVLENPTGSQYSTGSTVPKWNGSGYDNSYVLTADDVAQIKASTAGNPLYSGYAIITVPIDVKTAGAYTFDMTRVATAFANDFVFEDQGGEKTRWSSNNGASAVWVYRGTEISEDNLIGTTGVDRTNFRDIGDQPIDMSTKGALGTIPFKYLYRDDSMKGYLYSLTGKYVFDAELSQSDEYLTFVVKQMGFNSATAAGNGPDVMAYLDSLKIYGSGIEDAISAMSGEASVKYTAEECPSEKGNAVLALYNDGILVSVEKWTTYPEIAMFFKTEFEGTFDEAKVFIWEDFENCLPLTVVKELDVN